MATLMTIRPVAARTRTEPATFGVLASEAPVIPPVILPGELETLADKVACDQMEQPVVYAATDLIVHLTQVWGMTVDAVLNALHAATADGEHVIVHI